MTPVEYTVTASFVNHPSTGATTQTFSVSVLDPCEKTILTFEPVVVDMIATVNLGAEIQTIQATDTASYLNEGDGLTLCGARTYSITPFDLSFLSLSDDNLELQSSDQGDFTASPISITVTAELTDYPSVTVDASFSVQIADPCRTSTINFELTNDHITYLIGDTAIEQELVASDSASQNFGQSQDVSNLCGPIFFTLDPDRGTPLQLINDKLHLESSDQ